MKKVSTQPKLPIGFKNKWVKALRSGQYKQVQNSLYDFCHFDARRNEYVAGYCCLGVAGCVLGKTKSSMDGESALTDLKKVPVAITKVLKAETRNKDEYGDHIIIEKKLVQFNDIKKWSFKRIATWIEKNL